MNLLQGDCMELLPEIPDQAAALILCDLPYGTTDCKWDTRIPLGPLWEQYKRTIKPTGVIALFGSEPFSTALRTSNLTMYKYDWIWKKNTCTGFPHAKNMPLKNYEIISIFSPASLGHKTMLADKRMLYNPQGLIPCERYHNGQKKAGSIMGPRPSHKEKVKQEFTNYPKMVLQYNTEHGLHPTQKPVPLLEYLVRTYTNPGDTVLDNCMGSGSTGVACLRAGRHFIGMEKDPHYFQIAKERLEKEQTPTATPVAGDQ